MKNTIILSLFIISCIACSTNHSSQEKTSLSSKVSLEQSAPPLSDKPLPIVKSLIPEKSKYSLSDAHLHLVDFLQNSDGIQAVLSAMNKAGVTDAMISGMPLVKKWDPEDKRRPLYYLEDDARTYWYSATDVAVARALLSLQPEERNRFHPFITGFNGSDMNALDHIKRMIEWYPGLWQGIGEVMSRHDDLTALTYGETTRANNKALLEVYTFAASQNLPVSIHSNISSVWVKDPIFLYELEEAVKNHKKTKFIWCHAGVSRRVVVPSLIQELRRMLKSYKNLWVDISWVVYEDYIAPNGVPDKKWVDLFEEFPDRFMIGSDKVAKFGDYSSQIVKYDILLDQLKPETAKKIGRENFLAVLRNRI
jgi:hypothetical protein